MKDRGNVPFTDSVRQLLRRIVINERNEEYVISLPIGSKEIGGESMMVFFDEHGEIRKEVLELADDL